VKSYQQFFAELKRRHVFKVTAIYGAVSFVVLQVADILLPALGLPTWTITFMVAILLLAFPVALILAWAFEVTPDGVRKTESADEGEITAIIAEPASRRWLSGVLALLGVVALLASGWWIGSRSSARDAADDGSDTRLDLSEPEADPRPSIAVFPFADMSPGGDQEYFSDGISEELLNVLARVRELKVAARTSAFAFKGQDLTAEQLGDTLRVRYLVEGSVRKSGDQLRITAQLIDTRDGSHLWSESYDRTLDNVFAIQTEIAEAIAAELRVPLGLDDGELLVTPTADLEAYDLYLAGRARMRARGSGVAEAIELYEAAIARDSAWAPAWAGLAEASATLPWYLPGPYAERPWAEHLDAAELAAERALALDAGNATAWVALGNVYRERWDWSEAEQTYRKALSLDPDNVEAHQQYAELLAYVGRLDEALVAARRALSLDRVPIRLNVVGYVAGLNERYDEALAAYDEADRIDPSDALGYLTYNRFRTYLFAERWEEAREQFVLLERRIAGGQAGAVNERIAEAVRAWRPGDAPPAALAAAMAGSDQDVTGVELWMARGDRERALAALAPYGDRRYGERSRLWIPSFEPLLDEPAFQEILRRSNLAGVRPKRAAP
jgi:TolB-like protein